MQRDFTKVAAAMVAGAEKAVAAAVAPLKAENEELKARIRALEDRPVPTNGNDGVGVAGAVIDRSGVLVLTLSDGTTRDLGEVVGKDADMPALESKLREMVDAIPKPKDGKDGKDGRDGFKLEDFDIQRGEDGRTIILKFDGQEYGYEYELKLQHPIYCGVYQDGQEYEAGDCVTFGGSMFIACRDTKAKPETADSGWQLAVKRGRDGKDAK